MSRSLSNAHTLRRIADLSTRIDDISREMRLLYASMATSHLADTKDALGSRRDGDIDTGVEREDFDMGGMLQEVDDVLSSMPESEPPESESPPSAKPRAASPQNVARANEVETRPALLESERRSGGVADPEQAAWEQIGAHGTDWPSFFEFSPASRVIRTSIAMTTKDTTATMAVYARDLKAMFHIRDGRVEKLGRNWRRMHIRTRAGGRVHLGRTIESTGVQRTFIEPYRQDVASLVSRVLGAGPDACTSLDHIPLF